VRIRLTAHFDGRVIVPHEQIQLPPGEPLTVEVETRESSSTESVEARRAAMERLNSRPIKGLSIPPKALTREAMYSDDSP
jgi:hypothetical protein